MNNSRSWKLSPENHITRTAPPGGTIEDNLNHGECRIYQFNAECYGVTSNAIQIWHDIWLPKSRIKIVWGEPDIDFVKVRLSVPQWLIKRTLLDEYLKVD